MLMLTLLVTPLRQILHQPWLIVFRRMLGLFAFFYVTMHFLAWLVLDQGLDWSRLLPEIAKRPYITIGFLGFLLLIPLAVTSTNGMMRRLGRRWQKLHRLVYVVAALGVWHFYWQVKKDVREPLIYCAILAALLGWRALKNRATVQRSPTTTRRTEQSTLKF
jgi:sulfoxide reductase heme-binding subunit YedZ